MKKCKNEVEYSTLVVNGWTKKFKTKCGWFGDGKKRLCKKCRALIPQ